MQLLIDKTIHGVKCFTLQEHTSANASVNASAPIKLKQQSHQLVPIIPIPKNILSYCSWNWLYNVYVDQIIDYVSQSMASLEIDEYDIILDYAGMAKSLEQHVYTTSFNKYKRYPFLK